MRPEQITRLSWKEQIKFKSMDDLLQMREHQINFLSLNPDHYQTDYRVSFINEIDCELFFREKYVGKKV